MADLPRQPRPVKGRSANVLRDWLRIPDGLQLPGWVRTQLEGPVQAELEAREGTALDRVAFGIVDLETTGLAAARDRILEIGLVVQRGGRTIERFSTLIDIRRCRRPFPS